MEDFYFEFPQIKRKHINRYSKILATASYLPDKSISNEDIIQLNDLPFGSNVIIKAIGVENRHVAENWETDCDLLQKSADVCLDKYGLNPDYLSRIIVNKYYGDNILPMTASKLQSKLGCGMAVHAFDIDGGISSFLYSVDTAASFINTGDEYILISSGGITKRLVSKTDPRVAFLFGDASASILIGFSKEQHILASYFYSNCQYYDLAKALSPLTIVDMDDYSWENDKLSLLFDTYRMENWKIAEEFYRQAVAVVADNLLTESGLSMKNIDLVLVTENNRKIWELTLETLGVNDEKSLSLIKDCGNTMSAMLPLLLDHGFNTGRILPGMNIMLISHGEGISGGGIIYKV